jgi:tRNA/tmRNA/rRNA uracil-C5-methylase (TrmA/RlmC/RlmD family)
MVNEVEEVLVERPASGGGVGRMANGQVVFVRNALPGERVLVELSEVTSKFARGEAIEVLSASTDRVTPPCPYAVPGECGGCDLQHASVPAQSHWKAAIVEEQLRRVAGITRSVAITPAPGSAKGSRTRLRCGVDEEGRLGLRVARSHELVPLDECWIADERFNEAFAHTWRGAKEVELRAIGDGVPFAVVNWGDDFDIRTLDGLSAPPNVISRVSVRDFVYNVSPFSFWQSHRDAPEVLVEAVLSMAQPGKGDHVVDLYSGVGLFTMAMAKIVGTTGKVTAVESSPHSVFDARQNAASMHHVKVREWQVTPRSINDAVMPGDVVVLDPPRSGVAKGVVEALVRRQPRRIVYVSCDAATFARDLKGLVAGGYQLKELQAFDLFPMTEHVELVALLDI